jgi:hypothetical protein
MLGVKVRPPQEMDPDHDFTEIPQMALVILPLLQIFV